MKKRLNDTDSMPPTAQMGPHTFFHTLGVVLFFGMGFGSTLLFTTTAVAQMVQTAKLQLPLNPTHGDRCPTPTPKVPHGVALEIGYTDCAGIDQVVQVGVGEERLTTDSRHQLGLISTLECQGYNTITIHRVRAFAECVPQSVMVDVELTSRLDNGGFPGGEVQPLLCTGQAGPLPCQLTRLDKRTILDIKLLVRDTAAETNDAPKTLTGALICGGEREEGTGSTPGVNCIDLVLTISNVGSISGVSWSDPDLVIFGLFHGENVNHMKVGRGTLNGSGTLTFTIKDVRNASSGNFATTYLGIVTKMDATDQPSMTNSDLDDRWANHASCDSTLPTLTITPSASTASIAHDGTPNSCAPDDEERVWPTDWTLHRIHKVTITVPVP